MKEKIIKELETKIQMLKEDLNEYDGAIEYFEKYANEKHTEMCIIRNIIGLIDEIED